VVIVTSHDGGRAAADATVNGLLASGCVAFPLSFLSQEVERRGIVLLIIGGDDQQAGGFGTFLLLKGAKSDLVDIRTTTLLLPAVFIHTRRNVERFDIASRLTVYHVKRDIPVAGVLSIIETSHQGIQKRTRKNSYSQGHLRLL